ncbi:carboxypeptidase-like regulatory domain-containing protein [Oceanihabitans sp. 2_MG-2023]|uniref:carboxypeptidase-like regulatory domain-containing protein n=1 Tax=Oceanihabitans sp. 2_MG-2023 TaxID=3062661 RepID=UPI0026E3B148|nr:carboxypeptidase-like regulatory domain-containing protein [Oceanihabitans sp. 2_MG-2023]
MTKNLILLTLLLSGFITYSQTTILDKENKNPVSYATVSFGNGNGIFADDEGTFTFTKKLYADIDTLFISALGYKNTKIATANLTDTIALDAFQDALDEVLLRYAPKGKSKVETLKPTVHDDYYKCWLPTIESEIAVYFENDNPAKPKKVNTLLLPIKVEAKDWSKRKTKTSNKLPFSTLFRVQFYENNNGIPGDVLTYDKIIFRVTEASESTFKVDVTSNNIFIPKEGMYVSLQVLGYTDKAGKLLPNKKYREVKTARGIVKISTTFRPLLPFTDQVKTPKTYVKRIFLNNNQWILFDKKNIQDSNLLKAGLNNYAIGLGLQVFKEE